VLDRAVIERLIFPLPELAVEAARSERLIR
jgi:hypothetical protein